MSSKLKMLQRIQKARERMRNVAASEVAAAEQERRRCDSERERVERERQEILVSAGCTLGKVQRVSELELFGFDLRGADTQIANAEKVLHSASVVRSLAAQELRTRERKLRLSEKLVSRARKEINKAADKAEQAMIDDIVASKWSEK